MIELVRRLDRDRFRVHVACFDRAGAWLPKIAACAASIVEFPIRGLARPATIAQMLRFARWCRRERIEVLHACDFYANVFGLPAAWLAGVPVRIGSRRELNPDKSRWQILLQRQAYRFATTVVANSRAAKSFLAAEGLAADSILVIPNGVDLPAAADPARSSRPARTIVTVANLRPEKGHETLLTAAATLIHEYPDVQFQVVGGGPRRARLEALALALGLGDRVDFLGHREDVPSLLAHADIFVLPSRSEAFPNAAIEAMAAGVPVIASAVGGLRDLITDGETGLLVPADSPDRLAGAVRRLLGDPGLAARIGAAGRLHVAGRYGFATMVEAFGHLYLAGRQGGISAGARRVEAAGT